jgi:hypothetical protein
VAQPSKLLLGFADPNHYDTRSALARPGSTATVFGQGGLVDAGIGTRRPQCNSKWTRWITKCIGAVQKAGTAYNTFKGKNIASIANTEALKQVQSTRSYNHCPVL